MFDFSEIEGKFLVYKSNNCFIFGKVIEHCPSQNRKKQIILHDGSKISDVGYCTRKLLVVDLDGIEEHSKQFNGNIKFWNEINLSEEFEEALFVSILSDDDDTPVGLDYLIASYVFDNNNTYKFNEELLRLAKKALERKTKKPNFEIKGY